MKLESKVGMHAAVASELSVTCGDEASCDPTVPSSCLDCLRGPQLSESQGKHPMWRSPKSEGGDDYSTLQARWSTWQSALHTLQTRKLLEAV